jgi:hypothetical protein
VFFFHLTFLMNVAWNQKYRCLVSQHGSKLCDIQYIYIYIYIYTTILDLDYWIKIMWLQIEVVVNPLHHNHLFTF